MDIGYGAKELLTFAREALERDDFEEACMIMSDNTYSFSDYKDAIDVLNRVCGTSLDYTIYYTGNRDHFRAYDNNGFDEIENVKIVDGVKELKKFAFAKCSSIKEVKLPSSLEIIGVSAFNRCSELKRIDIPSNVKTICRSAFYMCPELSDININSGVSSIEQCAFVGCTKLKDMFIPSSVQNLGDDVFYSVDALYITDSQQVKLDTLTIPSKFQNDLYRIGVRNNLKQLNLI